MKFLQPSLLVGNVSIRVVQIPGNLLLGVLQTLRRYNWGATNLGFIGQDVVSEKVVRVVVQGQLVEGLAVYVSRPATV